MIGGLASSDPRLASGFVHQLFLESARRYPDEPAIDLEGVVTSYAELERRSARLADELHAGGAQAGDLLALLTTRPDRLIVGLLAALRAGCAFMPIDPATAPSRLRAMCTQARPHSWLLDGDLRQGLIKNLQAASAEDLRLRSWADPAIPSGSAAALLAEEHEWQGDDLCYVFMTSGSTGQPKAITGRLKAIDHFVRWEIEELRLGPGCRVSQLASPAFDACLRDIFVALAVGGTVCAPRSRATIRDARALARWLDRAQVEVLHCVPSLLRSLLGLPDRQAPALASLRYLLLAGEVLLPSDVERFVERYGERVQLVNLYGPSETTMTKLFYRVAPADGGRRFIPLGQPMPGAAVVLVDTANRACPQATVGEILIRTPYRSLGYLHDQELTQQVFVQNPFTDQPADIVYRTGDLARRHADGALEFVGRRDQQLKIRGVRVELGEVENVLRGCRGVVDVALVEVLDAVGFNALRAYLVLAEGVSTEAVRDHLLLHLDPVMVPSSWVELDLLPRTVSGKIDRRALLASAPRDAASVAPRTATEEILHGLWCELLGRQEVGVEANFFALGGHSLLATQMLVRLQSLFDLEVSLAEFFRAQTLAELAERVDQATRNPGGGRPVPLRQVPRDRPLALSFAQQRLWVLHWMEPASAAYNIPSAVRLRGPLRLPILHAAIRHTVARHEVLRTSFDREEPLQIIHSTVEMRCPMIDLSALSTLAGSEREAGRAAAQEARWPFDLERAPLLRVTLVKLAGDDHQVLFTLHHVVSDAWSIEQLVAEVAELYQAFADGQPAPLAELPLQYADYAAWQRQTLQGELLASNLAFWRHRLAGELPLLAVPTDRPRPAVASQLGGRVCQSLPPALVVELRRLSRRSGTTLFMTLLAAFEVLLYRLTGQRDLIVGTAVAGREHAAIQGLVGCFINMLPVRIEVDGAASFSHLLGSVREQTMAALSHQSLPFDRLVEELRPPRQPGVTPIFQVAFGLRNAPLEKRLIDDLELLLVERQRDLVRYDLTLWISDRGDGLAATWSYARDLFDRSTIESWQARYQTLLSSLCGDPEQSLDAVEWLSQSERQRQRLERQQRKAVNSRRLRKIRRRKVVAAARSESQTDPAVGEGALQSPDRSPEE